MPKVSIIMPAYNKENYIQKTLDSIIQQKFIDFELIIIDDGSTDKTRNILEEYRVLDKRIKIHHIENGGVSNARNIGLRHAVGDWIQFKDYEGTVEDITYRSTRLRTFENSIVNIPNSIIANESLINCSKIEKRRYKINLGITLETPLNKVKIIEEKIKTMLKEKEAVMDDSIIVKFDKITDNTINLLIYAFTDSVDYGSFLKQKEEINFKIMQILESENVELAYDTKTVYVKQ